MKSNDPRSIYYERKLEYNKINYLLIIIHIIILTSIIYIKDKIHVWLFLLLISLFILLSIKRAILLIIKIYQKLAPIHIRCKCRFEPSCSQYMILSIEKYGLIQGLIKGIKRIKRCNISNGGFDYP